MTIEDFNDRPLRVGTEVVFVMNKDKDGKYFIGSSEDSEEEMLVLGKVHAVDDEQVMILTSVVNEKNEYLKAWLFLGWDRIEELIQKKELKAI